MPKFGLITAFDAIHDQVAPGVVLRSIRSALADDGTFLMIDFKFSSRLEENLDNPFATLYYGIGTMHCLGSRSQKCGAGLGTVWGIELARSMLTRQVSGTWRSSIPEGAELHLHLPAIAVAVGEVFRLADPSRCTRATELAHRGRPAGPAVRAESKDRSCRAASRTV